MHHLKKPLCGDGQGYFNMNYLVNFLFDFAGH